MHSSFVGPDAPVFRVTNSKTFQFGKSFYRYNLIINKILEMGYKIHIKYRLYIVEDYP